MPAKFEERDVVIVGSGPGGCATALSLRTLAPELASKVLVIEALRHPREKICAGGVNGRAWQLMQEVGVFVDAPMVQVDRALIRTVLGDKRVESNAMTRVLRRDVYDEAVAAHLPEYGIELRQGVRLERVRRMGTKFEIETSAGPIRANAVIGADGAGSVVRRSLFDVEDNTYLMAMAVCAAPGHFTHTKNSIVLDFRKAAERSMGYRWIFPFLNEGEEWVNVGICEWRHQKARDVKADLIEYLRESELDAERADFRFFPERPFTPRGPFCAPGVILVGDAAGIDAFLGEGISYCFEYGMLAATSLAAALNHDDYNFLNHFKTLKWSRCGKELMVTWMATNLFYGRLHRSFVKAGIMDDQTVAILGEILAGRMRPSMSLFKKLAFIIVRNLLKF